MSESKSLTIEDPEKLITDKPAPFSGITITPATNAEWKELMLQKQKESKDEPLYNVIRRFYGQHPLDEFQVWVVNAQKEPILHWSDEEKMREYLKETGEFE